MNKQKILADLLRNVSMLIGEEIEVEDESEEEESDEQFKQDGWKASLNKADKIDRNRKLAAGMREEEL